MRLSVLVADTVQFKIAARKTERIKMHFLHGVLGVGAALAFFALTVVPLVEAAKTEWTVVFSVFLLGEKPTVLR